MENKKMKFEDVAKEVTTEAFFEAIGLARPKYKNLSNREMSLLLGLSEAQFKHFAEKALPRAISDKISENMLKHLKEGNSIEIPHQFNIFVHESEVRVNDQGEPVKKISVRTRRALKEELNQK